MESERAQDDELVYGRNQSSDAYDSLHGTNNYITVWDAICWEPSDVYADISDVARPESLETSD